MALMFRSVLQSGGGAELVVTCDSEFAGATISCSDGTTTLNKTCPVSSPYEVTFKIPNSGDWTVSATVSGTTYSSDPISVDLDYEADLEFGFNWRRWVDTSVDLDSTDYQSLAEVLADEEAVRELFTVHACVDYMASASVADTNIQTILNDNYAAKWINLRDYALDTLYANAALAAVMDTADKYFYGEWGVIDSTTTPVTWGALGNVPVMASNSAPYGEASGSSANASYPHYKAFDGDDTSYFETANNVSVGHIYYKFANPTNVKKFHIVNGSSMGGTLKIRYSDDGSTWADCNEEFTLNANGDGTAITDGVIDDYGYHLYWDACLTPTSSAKMRIKTLQFYGRELSVSVPTMTSNTTPFGEASNSEPSAVIVPAWKAFDRVSDASNARNYAACQLEGRLIYKFNNKVKCMMVYHEQNYDGGTWYVTKAEIQASNDGVNFTKIADMNITPANNGKTYLSLNNSDGYKYWAFYAKSDGASSGVISEGVCGVAELQFYCKDYSEKEFEQGSTKKWLYDHGLELVNSITKVVNTNSVASKRVNDLYAYVSGQQYSYAGIVFDGIDFTSYSLIRAKAGDELYESSDASSFMLSIYSTNDPTYNTNAEARIFVSTINTNTNKNMLPNNLALDVSSLNTTYYACFDNGNSTGTVTRKGTLKELWLE